MSMDGLSDLLNRLDDIESRLHKNEVALGDHYIRLQAIEHKSTPQVETLNLLMDEALKGDLTKDNPAALSKSDILRKAMMCEGPVGGSGASGGKSYLCDPLVRENEALNKRLNECLETIFKAGEMAAQRRKEHVAEVTKLNSQIIKLTTDCRCAGVEIEKLVTDRANRCKQHEIDQDAIRGLQNQNSDLIQELDDARKGRATWMQRAQERKGFTIDVVRIHKCVQNHRWVAGVRFDTDISPETNPKCPECNTLAIYSTPTLLRYPSGGLAEIKGIGDLHAKEYFI